MINTVNLMKAESDHPLFISVVLPTHNRPQFVKEAIDSVLCQTFQNFELIVVDDGSDDETQSVVESYLHDNRVQLITQPNRGVSSARNAGLKKASAKWIAFLDSDDKWLPEKLQYQWNYISNHPEVFICQTEEIWVRNGLRVNPKKKHQKHSGWIFEKCIPLCIVSPSSVMIHRNVFDRCGLFDETFPACEDYDLWLRIALEYQVITLSEKLIVKRGGHDDQLSRKYWGLDRFRVKALEKILTHPKITRKQRKLVERSIYNRVKILEKGAEKRGYDPSTL